MTIDQRALLLQAQESLQRGGLDLGRAQFTAALRYFRSPDLVFGEVLALRGLAEVAIAQGRSQDALDYLDQAAQTLERLDSDAYDVQDRVDAVRAALGAVRAEALLELDQADEAWACLEQARAHLPPGTPTQAAATVVLTGGRLALREGRESVAREWLEQALAMSQEGAHARTAVLAALALADLATRGRDAARSVQLLGEVIDAARRTGDAVLSACLDVSLGDAELSLDTGDEAAATHREEALQRMIRGVTVLAREPGAPGLQRALLRLAHQARRWSRPRLALAAAELARRAAASRSDVVGVGEALRVVTKALHQLGDHHGAGLAATVREALAGDQQRQARIVAAWYRQRLGESLGEDRPVEVQLADVRRSVERGLEEVIARHGRGPAVLDEPAFGVELLRLLRVPEGGREAARTTPLPPETPLFVPRRLSRATLGALVVEGGSAERVFLLDQERIIVGRGRDADLQVRDDAQVSRTHFAVSRDADGYRIEPLSTTHALRVSGRPVLAVQPLQHGDVIEAGRSTFRFVGVDEQGQPLEPVTTPR